MELSKSLATGLIIAASLLGGCAINNVKEQAETGETTLEKKGEDASVYKENLVFIDYTHQKNLSWVLERCLASFNRDTQE